MKALKAKDVIEGALENSLGVLEVDRLGVGIIT
jgi:hypothetical protein